MKTVILYIVFLIIFSPSGNCQQQKIDLNISGGLSLPVGRFADKNYVQTFNKPDGLAKSGYGINLSLYYHYRKEFGFLLLAGYSSNRQDLSDFEKVTHPNNYNGIARTNIVDNSWKIFKAMPGIYYETALSPAGKFRLRPSLSAGLCKATKPEAQVYYYNSNGDFLALTQSDRLSLAASFCLQADLNFSYSFSRKLYVFFDAGYFYADPAHKFSYQNTSGNSVSAKTKYNLSSVNTFIGLGIRL